MVNKQSNEILTEILQSKKYKTINKDLIKKIIGNEYSSNLRYKENIKKIKNKLHQIGGAFRNNINYEKLICVMQSVNKNNPDEVKEFCKAAMLNHSSTRERAGFIDSFYKELFCELIDVKRIIDIGCGLNPLGYFFIPHNTHIISYKAYDIYTDMMDFLNYFFNAFSIKGNAVNVDIMDNFPGENADLTIIMKLFPTLEQVEKGSTEKILSGINSRYAIISFPTKSIGGHNKGMAGTYNSFFLDRVNRDIWSIVQKSFPNEQVYILERKLLF